jgi:predicted helicase
MVKRAKHHGNRIFYVRRPELETAEEKLAFLSSSTLRGLQMDEIRPDTKQNWINLTNNDFDSLLLCIDKNTKASKSQRSERAVFKLFSRGVATQRDEWVYDLSAEALERKMRFFVDSYERARQTKSRYDTTSIKWDRELEYRLVKDLWAFTDDRIAVRFQYEWHDVAGQWHRHGADVQYVDALPTRSAA